MASFLGADLVVTQRYASGDFIQGYMAVGPVLARPFRQEERLNSSGTREEAGGCPGPDKDYVNRSALLRLPNSALLSPSISETDWPSELSEGSSRDTVYAF